MGTVINFFAVILGGVFGKLFGNALTESAKKTLTATCGISVMFISIAGAMEGMLKLKNNSIISYNSMFVVICLILGAVLGEILNIEYCFEKFGNWLKIKTKSEKDNNFVEAFITASFTICIGAMTIIGSINDGVKGDSTILITKSILDFIIISVLTSSLGKGSVFSCIPVLVIEGGITLLAKLIKPYVTNEMLFFISLIGSILIFCVGVNLVFDKKVKVANLLPALIFAIIYAFLPFRF